MGTSPSPEWLNQYFATAVRPTRVLANLVAARFPLPGGVTSVSVPIIGTAPVVQPVLPGAPVPAGDITDSAGSSAVATMVGSADVSLQALEQSPAGAHLDWALFSDMAEAADADLENQLLYGLGSSSQQLVGLTTIVPTGNQVTYTSGSPTGQALFPYLGQVASRIGDARDRPMEAWLMRSARLAWLFTQADQQGRPLETPDPGTPGTGSICGKPIFEDDAILATQGAGNNQDTIVGVRPSDLLLFEGEPQTAVMREPGSGSLSARVQMHVNVAAITNRYPSGIGIIEGTGLVVQTGY